MKPTKLPTLQKPKRDWYVIIGNVLAYLLFVFVLAACVYLVVKMPIPKPTEVLPAHTPTKGKGL